MSRTGFKHILYLLHLWLGLSTGLVVLIVSLSGSIYSFSSELRELFYRDRLFVEHVSAARSPLPFGRLLEIAQQRLGEKKVSRVEIYMDPKRSYMFRAFKAGKYFEKVYVDPYSGHILFHEDAEKEFFNVVLSLHRTLLLGDAVGHFIIQWSVVVFVFLLLSGIVLWCPKHWKWKSLKQKLSVKWSARKKRLNYDLHQTGGFYAFLVLLVIALTGLMWSFKLTTERKSKALSDTTAVLSTNHGAILSQVRAEKLPISYLLYNIPAAPSGTVNVSAYLSPELIHQRVQFRFDQYSGNLLSRSERFEKLPLMEQVVSLNYDLHTGSIGGFFGKLLVCVMGLVSACLPITGFLMWRWRGNKKKPTHRTS